MKVLVSIALLLFSFHLAYGEKQVISFQESDFHIDYSGGIIPEGIYNDKSQTLTIQLTSSDGYFVLITDSAGDMILREPLKTDGSCNSISLTSLDNGLYFVFLESTTNRFIGKIFID